MRQTIKGLLELSLTCFFSTFFSILATSIFTESKAFIPAVGSVIGAIFGFFLTKFVLFLTNDNIVYINDSVREIIVFERKRTFIFVLFGSAIFILINEGTAAFFMRAYQYKLRYAKELHLTSYMERELFLQRISACVAVIYLSFIIPAVLSYKNYSRKCSLSDKILDFYHGRVENIFFAIMWTIYVVFIISTYVFLRSQIIMSFDLANNLANFFDFALMAICLFISIFIPIPLISLIIDIFIFAFPLRKNDSYR